MRGDSFCTKATSKTLLDTFFQLLEVLKEQGKDQTPTVYQTEGRNGLTAVISPNGVWFYHFPSRETPVAKLTSTGEYVSLGIISLSTRERIAFHEEDLTVVLKEIIAHYQPQ